MRNKIVGVLVLRPPAWTQPNLCPGVLREEKKWRNPKKITYRPDVMRQVLSPYKWARVRAAYLSNSFAFHFIHREPLPPVSHLGDTHRVDKEESLSE